MGSLLDVLIAADSPTAWWKLGADATDSSTGGHNGTVNGSVTFGQTGINAANSAALFDGSTGYITSGYTVASVPLTVIAFYNTTSSAKQIIFDNRNASFEGMFADLSDAAGNGLLTACDAAGGNNVTDTVATNDGNWHMVAAVYAANGALTLYRDAVNLGSTTPDTFVGASTMQVGARSAALGAVTRFWNGDIQEVAVIPSALSGAQVSAIWQAAKVVATTTVASGFGSTSATLNGTVTPNALDLHAYFQWGTTTGYGNTTPSQDMGSGTGVVSVSANITGLTAGQTYHFQEVATNANGTVYGGDQTFIALPPAGPSSGLPLHTITYKLASVFTGQVLAELPLTSLSFTLVLNQAGPFQADLNIEDPLVQSASWIVASAINKTALWVDIDNTLAYGGIVTDRTYTMSKGSVALSGQDHIYYLGLRLQAKDYGSTWASTSAAASTIAQSVVADALVVPGSLPMIISGATAAPSQYWVPFSAPISQRLAVGMIVQELSSMGYEIGFDYVSKPIYLSGLPTPQLTFGYPQIGNTPPNPLLVMDVANALEFTYDENGTQQANGIVEMLSGAGGVSGEFFAAGPISAGWPLLEAVCSHSSMSSIPAPDSVTLAFSLADLAMRAYPLTTATITYPLFDDTGMGDYPSWGQWQVGDDVLLILQSSSIIPANPRFPNGLQFVFRIVKADVKIPEEGIPTVTFTLNVPPSQVPILPPGV